MQRPREVRPVEALSPSAYEVLAACPLRLAYDRSGQRGGGGANLSRAPVQRIGILCHQVVEALVADGSLQSGAWEQRLDDVWEEAAQRETAAERSAGDDARYGPLRKHLALPGVHDRLQRMLKRLADHLAGLPSGAQALPERRMRSRDGALHGTADVLVLLEGQPEEVIDIKTGGLLDQDADKVKDAHRRQLRMYAYLAAETYGTWPERVRLEPLRGEGWTEEVDPEACIALAHQARALREQFNSRLSQVLAHPSVAHCRHCPNLGRCPDVWQSVDETWSQQEGVLARGRIVEVRQHRNGRRSLLVEASHGSIPPEPARILVRDVPPAGAAATPELRTDVEVALSGLLPDDNGWSYRLSRWGQIVLGQ